MATHSSTLAWRIPWMEEPGGLQSMESQSRTQLSDFTSLYGSRVVDRDLLPLVVVVQSLSLVQLFATPWTAAHQASLSISCSSLKLMSIDSMMPSNHLVLCHPFLLLPSIFPSITIFSNESHLLPTPNIFMVQEKHEGPQTICLNINFKSN